MNRPASILSITLKRGVWRLTLDGAFYGDYRSQRHASESADAAAAAIRSEGRSVNIITSAATP